MEKKRRQARILIVEDDPGDLNMIKRFFQESKLNNDIFEVTNGRSALDFLFHKGSYEEEQPPKPDLILLDLNLPKVDGREVLEEINASDHLKDIPVVVLTTSEEESDVCRSYELGASSYIVKPVNMDQFVETIKTLQQYWFEIVVLPGDEDDS